MPKDDPSRPLRIALLTHSVNPRGGVVHTLELAEALQAAGHQITVLAPASPEQRFFREVSCEVELIPAPPSATDLVAMVESRIDACVKHLTSYLPGHRFDILHSQDSITGNALATLDSIGSIRGFVRTVHHLDHFGEDGLMALQRRAFMRAERVLCVSRLWQDTLLTEYQVDAALVSNGVNLARYHPVAQPADAEVAARYGLQTGGPVYLALGGVEGRKNTQRVLDAFVQLRADQPTAQLVIAGGASLLDHDAYMRGFWAKAERSGLTIGPGQALVPIGPVPDDEVSALMRLADAVVMASVREGFGLVVLEAMASGTPVVASRIAPFTEYLKEDDVSWADPMDTTSIADAMRAAATRPAFTLPEVCRRFSWADSAARHVALYRELTPCYAPFCETCEAAHA
jgi:glycosyltransferase-like protein